MAEVQQSDALKQLVWFLTGLAILGVIIALVAYFTGIIPVEQAEPHAPALLNRLR